MTEFYVDLIRGYEPHAKFRDPNIYYDTFSALESFHY